MCVPLAPPMLSLSLCVCVGKQSALEPDLQAKGVGARENAQPAEPGAGIAGAAGGIQTQRLPQRDVPQPAAIGPK